MLTYRRAVVSYDGLASPGQVGTFVANKPIELHQKRACIAAAICREDNVSGVPSHTKRCLMAELELPILGSCRCGEVQMRISALPILSMACHCKGCQKMSASAYSLSAAIPTSGFDLIQGEPVIGGMRDPGLKHHFCPQCMSWLFTRFAPEFVNVRTTMFNGLSSLPPFIETWTKAKLPWVTMPALRSYDQFPPVEAFESLTAEFARWLPRI